MNQNLTIVYNGDSWTFGSEVTDPALIKKHPNIPKFSYDFTPENDAYRTLNIYPKKLSDKLNAEAINLAWPGDDNKTILRRTIDFVTRNYLIEQKPTDNLFLIIGWTSPERTSFWYKDEKVNYNFRLLPQNRHFESVGQEEFWKTYVSYIWNPEEYLTNFAIDILMFQNFCISHNIKYLSFNAFYQLPNTSIKDWPDINLYDELNKMDTGFHYFSQNLNNVKREYTKVRYQDIWKLVDRVRFYKKDLSNSTFKSFISSKQYDFDKVFADIHPNENGHNIWAEELFNYIKENNLL